MEVGKNDYRRALIMLRGLEKGYAGHARLEKRVTSGTLDFTVSTPMPGEALSAALIGSRGGRMAIKPLGAFRDDDRGQKGLLASFDPRNIEGMELSDVTAAVVLREEEGGLAPVMYGWINGSKPMDWAETAGAIRTFYARPTSISRTEQAGGGDLPATPGTEANGSDTPATPEAEANGGDTPATLEAEATVTYENPQTEASGDDAPVSSGAEATAAYENPPTEANGSDAPATPEAEKPAPAGKALGLDMSQKWPEDVDELRALFLTLPRYEPFELDGFVFVRAGMAAETGIDHCAVGIRAEDGRVTGVSYAIPMAYSADPPAGLEDAVWIGDANRGWWVTVQNLSGEG